MEWWLNAGCVILCSLAARFDSSRNLHALGTRMCMCACFCSFSIMYGARCGPFKWPKQIVLLKLDLFASSALHQLECVFARGKVEGREWRGLPFSSAHSTHQHQRSWNLFFPPLVMDLILPCPAVASYYVARCKMITSSSLKPIHNSTQKQKRERERVS